MLLLVWGLAFCPAPLHVSLPAIGLVRVNVEASKEEQGAIISAGVCHLQGAAILDTKHSQTSLAALQQIYLLSLSLGKYGRQRGSSFYKALRVSQRVAAQLGVGDLFAWLRLVK